MFNKIGHPTASIRAADVQAIAAWSGRILEVPPCGIRGSGGFDGWFYAKISPFQASNGWVFYGIFEDSTSG